MTRSTAPDTTSPIIKHPETFRLADVMRRCRLAMGITQKEMSTYCQVTQSTISRIERGKTYPSATMVESIAEFLNLDSRQLLIVTVLSALDKPGIKEHYLDEIMRALKADHHKK